MPGDFQITGVQQLDRLGKQLKATGNKELRKELLRGIRTAARPLTVQVRATALVDLPKRGGLAAKIATSRFSTRTRLSGDDVGVRIQAKNPIDLESLDQGRLRHPLFGNRKHWYEQSVQPGWFERPIERNERVVVAEITKTMNQVAAKIEKSV